MTSVNETCTMTAAATRLRRRRSLKHYFHYKNMLNRFRFSNSHNIVLFIRLRVIDCEFEIREYVVVNGQTFMLGRVAAAGGVP